MYRLLQAHQEVPERRRVAKHPPSPKPMLMAHQPNEVWTWGITQLPGPRGGMFYYLYLMLDLFSRYVVGWMLTNEESSHYAKHFIRICMQRTQEQTNIRELTIHSDRGASMTANGARHLLDILAIRQSFSRPRVSNDNPFSEAQFRTLKYHSTYPRFFESEPTAR